MAFKNKRSNQRKTHESAASTARSHASSSSARIEYAARKELTAKRPAPFPPLQRPDGAEANLPPGHKSKSKLVDQGIENVPKEVFEALEKEMEEEVWEKMAKETTKGKMSYASVIGGRPSKTPSSRPTNTTPAISSSGQSTTVSGSNPPSINTEPNNGPPFPMQPSQDWESSRTVASISPYLNMAPRTIKTNSTFPPSLPVSEDEGPVYFWRTSEEYGCLAQWYYAPFTYNGEKYETTEKWMMVHKARLFENWALARRMLGAKDPKTVKAMGRMVQGFDEDRWEMEKRRIVHEGNYLKFTLSDSAPELQAILLQTGERELVEASPRDRIWGIGFDKYSAGAMRHQWGENVLGKVLVGVRQRIRDENARASCV